MNRLIWKTLVFLSRLRTTIKYVAALPFTYRNWWAVPLVKVGRSAVLELRDGTRLLVRPGTTDLAAVNEAAIQNPYLGHSRIVLHDAATVIDIGAYIGDFTVQVARRCPRGRIVAVEPIREHVDMIASQLMLNRLSNVETVCAAVGAADGDGEVSSAGIASRIGAAGASSRRVPVMTLETMMADYRIDRVDLLKLDCEGAEWDILPAAEGVLPRIDQICM
ncbi:MAG TPA: FkbM family methyltransferase, partial [Vicinamibacterales bacterium]